MIGALGQQVLRTALADARRLASGRAWSSDDVLHERQPVGPPARRSRRLPSRSARRSQTAGLPAEALKLEITESTLMQELERTQHVFAEVCATGVGLHLDDFGTGYSSLTALHRFPVDALKIDRSFVASLTDGERQRRDRALDGGARAQPRPAGDRRGDRDPGPAAAAAHARLRVRPGLPVLAGAQCDRHPHAARELESGSRHRPRRGGARAAAGRRRGDRHLAASS